MSQKYSGGKGAGLPSLKNGSDFDIGSALDVSSDMEVAMQELYDRLDVKAQNETIKTDVQKYINGMVKGKLGDTEIGVAKFAIDMLVKMEARSLTSAFKQTMYLEHIIDTLMVRIDENFGGSNGDYYTLMHLQGALLQMQQHLMQVVRQLPVNLQNSVNITLENFSIEVEAIEKAEGEENNGIIARTADLIENIEKIGKEVESNNKAIDEMIPEELPKEWIINDDALINTKTVEEAREYEAKYGLGAEKLEGATQFPDNEFDDDED